MNARQLIESEFLSSFFRKNRHYIGTELEFPLLNLNGSSVESAVIIGLTEYLLANGFSTEETDIYGNGVFLINRDGDCLSFDNSYNNFEFAMAKNTNLTAISRRVYKLYELVQDFLLQQNHTLTGLGTNPHHHQAETQPVEYPIYRVLRRFLSDFSGGYYHCFTDFPAWLSSVQTHLDVSAEQLPQALTLFSALDFVRGLLFSNSLPFPDVNSFESTVCFRDYLWEHSGFGSLADNTGPLCGSFQTKEDIIDMFLKKSIFLHFVDGTYQPISAVSLEKFCRLINSPTELNGYLSFKNVEITRRGTLEIRSDCAQPLSSAFAPPAFNLGLLHGLKEAADRLDSFFELLPPELAKHPKRNKELRTLAVNGRDFPVSKKDLSDLLFDLVSIAKEKLVQRGLGEEQLLSPLIKRAETLTCPAKLVRKRLNTEKDFTQIIRDFANPDYKI